MTISPCLLELLSFKDFQNGAPAVPVRGARAPSLLTLLCCHKTYLPLQFGVYSTFQSRDTKPEVTLQYHNKPPGGPKSNHFEVLSRCTHIPNMETIHQGVLELFCTQTDTNETENMTFLTKVEKEQS